ncbi:uncharacterized protein MYCGRDRAFT_104764 [Zymoseptoria tritici IPO323]|uniref:Tat pathway signal sequence protein n=1 Tax=Zymoseptoria tritici (strain CBS 115943 / IPO323) TaxID=336722 RepID=F9XCW0_ZYMTI|nr:uncharacterized protein MYCGRDRAFT_104764 [Zymoseptoria tritici IPO323]EGP86900.1 hypothetical protein MYCGRDRAFT_104764 [Zymoseptoria tritici IPO323]
MWENRLPKSMRLGSVCLVVASHIFISPEEAKSLEGDLWQEPESGLYTAHVTVFHDLHCMNMIRKALRLEHYPELRSYDLQDHIDHCVDVVRESLMCTGEMTLVPVRWSENRGAPNPDFAVPHTCRDYEALRTWSLARDATDPARYPENARRLRSQWGIE